MSQFVMLILLSSLTELMLRLAEFKRRGSSQCAYSEYLSILG